MACGLGLAAGLWQAARAVPWDFRPGPAHTAWVERYRALRPLLGDATAAHFLHDFGPDPARHRLFRAQFELAPCVLVDRSDLRRVAVESLRATPLILDFHDRSALESALATLEAAARDADMVLDVERRPGTLAVVRARRGA